MGICAHHDEPHTIWYWIDDPNDPIPAPYVAKFDNVYEAIRQAESWLKEAGPSLRWMKIFRSDNETYTCWRWENPEPGPEPEKVVIANHLFMPSRPKWFKPRCKVCREFEDHPLHKV